jgi:hypothetical protein
VPLAGPLLQDLRVDALSIISNPQPEELAIVRDLGLDAAGNCAAAHSGMKTATTTVRTSRNSRLLGECRRKSMLFRTKRWLSTVKITWTRYHRSSHDTATIPHGDALLGKQFGPERSTPLPCPAPRRSRVSTGPSDVFGPLGPRNAQCPWRARLPPRPRDRHSLHCRGPSIGKNWLWYAISASGRLVRALVDVRDKPCRGPCMEYRTFCDCLHLFALYDLSLACRSGAERSC